MSERTDLNRQEAPYPQELQELVTECELDPGWQIHLVDLDRGQGSKGLTLRTMYTGEVLGEKKGKVRVAQKRGSAP